MSLGGMASSHASLINVKIYDYLLETLLNIFNPGLKKSMQCSTLWAMLYTERVGQPRVLCELKPSICFSKRL